MFSVTELIAALGAYSMLDKQSELRVRTLWAMFVIGAWHIAESLIDQGFVYDCCVSSVCNSFQQCIFATREVSSNNTRYNVLDWRHHFDLR